MKNEERLLANLTEAKVSYIESQVEKLYEFAIANRRLLTQAAHTTLQWLFAILIGGSSYIVTLLNSNDAVEKTRWWLIVPLSIVVLIAFQAALYLFLTALTATALPPPGNEPNNLGKPELLKLEPNVIRFMHAMQMQEPIEKLLSRNQEVGKAINKVRMVVAILPIVAILLAAVCNALFKGH